MAERPELTPGRAKGPSPEQVRRRRLVALVAIVAAVDRRGRRGRRRVPARAPLDTAAPAAAAAAAEAVPHRLPGRVHARADGRSRQDGRARLPSGSGTSRWRSLGGRISARRERASIPCFAPRRRTNLEGFLFPATYDFLANDDVTPSSSSDQLARSAQNWAKVNLAYARSKNLTPYDVLMIASMVEKETLAPEERPLVAAVIYNRLHAHMPLGIDATLRYGLHIPPTKSILESQLQSDNPYNSRKLPGLPPTPIANPGLASIQAAAHPAHVDYLYFVRKPDKVHHFFTASAPRSRSTSARTATVLLPTRQVALLGHPVAQSLSPRMQNAAFAARGLDWHYEAFDVR